MTIGWVALAAGAMWAVELWRPGRAWPAVAGWWPRAIALNAVQVAIVFAAGIGWEGWMAEHRPPWTDAVRSLGPVAGAAVGYVVITFVYYWWHRARHQSDFLWRWFHQVHHSPARLEIVTSFYKHPFEILVNGLLSSAILFCLVGVSPAAAALAVAATGVAELFYHWNVSTPRWLGFLIQRPESHCVHHETGRHRSNYGDLPLWDMLFGTFDNPQRFESRCGFERDGERRLGELLRGRDLEHARPVRRWDRATVLAAGLLAVGLLQMVGDVARAPKLAGLGAATAASPAPRVFSSVRGLETYSSRYFVAVVDADGTTTEIEVTPERYAQLAGPYNRRNAYGAVVAYAPLLADDAATRPLLESVARHALCGQAPLLTELGVAPAAGADGSVGVRVDPIDGTHVAFPLHWEVAC